MSVSLAAAPAPHTVIHLGAGKGDRLGAFRKAGAQRIVLIEPEAGMAAALDRQAEGQAEGQAQVIAGAIAATDGRGELAVMNLPQLNSLAAATPALREIYPGLRLRDRQEVRLISPARLLQEIGAAGAEVGRPLLLVLQQRGTELAVLAAWKADGALERIDQLELHCAEVALFEGAAPRAALESWLAAEGFAVTARDLSDPDWPVLHLQADHAARALTRATARIAELTAALAQADTALAEAKAATAEKTAALTDRDTKLKVATDRAAALDTALAEAKATAAEKTAALADRDAKLKAATDRAAALDTALAEAKATAAEKTAALADRDTKLKAATDRAAALSGERDALALRCQTLDRKCHLLQQEFHHTRGQVELIKELFLKSTVA